MQTASYATGAISPTLSRSEVAKLLGYKSSASFDRIRKALEAKGFPPKLPALPVWSGPCVMRWIETNGETAQPDEAPAFDGGDHEARP